MGMLDGSWLNMSQQYAHVTKKAKKSNGILDCIRLRSYLKRRPTTLHIDIWDEILRSRTRQTTNQQFLTHIRLKKSSESYPPLSLGPNAVSGAAPPLGPLPEIGNTKFTLRPPTPSTPTDSAGPAHPSVSPPDAASADSTPPIAQSTACFLHPSPRATLGCNCAGPYRVCPPSLQPHHAARQNPPPSHAATPPPLPPCLSPPLSVSLPPLPFLLQQTVFSLPACHSSGKPRRTPRRAHCDSNSPCQSHCLLSPTSPLPAFPGFATTHPPSGSPEHTSKTPHGGTPLLHAPQSCAVCTTCGAAINSPLLPPSSQALPGTSSHPLQSPTPLQTLTPTRPK
ncbi:uncharacterized protein [Agelaius tricolor]|uniref:uncharacterized protein n=1 Tax=Agelaius tricolor TaxID=9191 RepID=UPI0039F2403E